MGKKFDPHEVTSKVEVVVGFDDFDRQTYKIKHILHVSTLDDRDERKAKVTDKVHKMYPKHKPKVLDILKVGKR